jgi:hypothetical protein
VTSVKAVDRQDALLGVGDDDRLDAVAEHREGESQLFLILSSGRDVGDGCHDAARGARSSKRERRGPQPASLPSRRSSPSKPARPLASARRAGVCVGSMGSPSSSR